MSTPISIYEAASEAVKSGRSFALCIIIEKQGSAPRDVGSKMIVFEDGTKIGTLGGGAFERLVISEAIKALKEGKSKVLTFSFMEQSPPNTIPTGLICGGLAKVYIDVVKPRPTIYLLGAGHIAKPLADIINILGFPVIVVDDNPDFANRDRYPYAKDIIVDTWEEALRKIKPNERDIIIIVYGEIEKDYKALKRAIETNVSYIGLLGSRRKVRIFLDRLKGEGIDINKLKGRLYAPIGLDLNADTPEEVAISIIAEVLKIIKGGSGEHLTIVK